MPRDSQAKGKRKSPRETHPRCRTSVGVWAWSVEIVSRAWRTDMPEARGAADTPTWSSRSLGQHWGPSTSSPDAEGKWWYLGCFSPLHPSQPPSHPVRKRLHLKNNISYLAFNWWDQDPRCSLYRRSLPFSSAHFPLPSLFIDSFVFSYLFLQLSLPFFLHWHCSLFYSLFSLLSWGTLSRREQRKVGHPGGKFGKHAQRITQIFF